MRIIYSLLFFSFLLYIYLLMISLLYAFNDTNINNFNIDDIEFYKLVNYFYHWNEENLNFTTCLSFKY